MSLTLNMVGGGGGGLSATDALLRVQAPAGSTVTITKGTTTKTDLGHENEHDHSVYDYYFIIHQSQFDSVNPWTVTATLNTASASDTVIINAPDEYDVVLAYWYGVKRLTTASDPSWTREGGSANYTATASVGVVAGSSDFDNVYPWNQIQRETLSTGDVMVKIPKFGFKRYIDGDSYEHIQIAPNISTEFPAHPAFLHNGTTQDYIYVGAYKTSANYKSETGVQTLVNTKKETYRTNSANKGTGWGIIDITTCSAIMMLILVEFANNNVQSVIGAGYTNNSTLPNVGECDNVPNLTGRPAGTDNQVQVVYRGIENFWGVANEGIDGANINGQTLYFCNNQSQYADNTSTNYTQLSYSIGSTSFNGTFTKNMGFDLQNPAIIFAINSGGSATTYNCDGAWSGTGWRTISHGGNRTDDTKAGILCFVYSSSSTEQVDYVSSRLLYIPS